MKMVCATRQNDVRAGWNGRPWENDVRLSVRVDVRAIFIQLAIKVYEVLRPFLLERRRITSWRAE
jgi:hypothetical protein